MPDAEDDEPICRPIAGQPLRYEVESFVRPGIFYQVDLAAFAGAGSCNCPRFVTHWGPQLKSGLVRAEALRQSLVCKHVQRAWREELPSTKRARAEEAMNERAAIAERSAF